VFEIIPMTHFFREVQRREKEKEEAARKPARGAERGAERKGAQGAAAGPPRRAAGPSMWDYYKALGQDGKPKEKSGGKTVGQLDRKLSQGLFPPKAPSLFSPNAPAYDVADYVNFRPLAGRPPQSPHARQPSPPSQRGSEGYYAGVDEEPEMRVGPMRHRYSRGGASVTTIPGKLSSPAPSLETEVATMPGAKGVLARTGLGLVKALGLGPDADLLPKLLPGGLAALPAKVVFPVVTGLSAYSMVPEVAEGIRTKDAGRTLTAAVLALAPVLPWLRQGQLDRRAQRIIEKRAGLAEGSLEDPHVQKVVAKEVEKFRDVERAHSEAGVEAVPAAVKHLTPGQPLPNRLEITVRGSSNSPNSFKLQIGRDDQPLGAVKQPGLSATIATDLTPETEYMQMFGRETGPNDLLSGAFVEDIRAAGFEVVYAPTRRNPLHVRIVPRHNTFDDAGRQWLSLAFDKLARVKKKR
jgi:hypothetical protein